MSVKYTRFEYNPDGSHATTLKVVTDSAASLLGELEVLGFDDEYAESEPETTRIIVNVAPGFDVETLARLVKRELDLQRG